MDYLNKRKPNHAFFLLLSILALYVGYCLGNLYGQDVTLDTIADLLKQVLLHPLPLRKTPYTIKTMGAMLVIWGLAYMYYISSIRNYMPGREYGSARLASPKELNKFLQDKNPHNNKIVSEHIRISLDTRKTGLNNNMIIIGGSGAGKTFYMVKPNGLNLESSYLFCDPKGELTRDIGAYLEMEGYHIIVLDLIDMDYSDGYNPFAYIRSDEDIIKLITNLIANTTPKGATPTDPFWEKAEGMYLQSLMYYVWYEFPKQGRTPNFRGVLELLNKAKIPEDENELSDLDKIMYSLPEDHLALITYKKVRSGAADTVRSIIISANSRLAYLQNPKILRILDRDDMNIAAMGEGVYGNPERKTALFCRIPDNDKSYNFIVGMLYTQIFQELYYVADRKHGGRLPVPVAFWMDEFANVALPDGFCEILSTMRSREISCNIIIQNLAQIKALFKDSWETITGNCDTMVYLGGNEQSTHKYTSEMLGKITIDKKSSGETLGSHGSSSRNYDVLGRDMMDPAEVRKIHNRKCVVFVRGFDPVIDDKYRTWAKEEFKAANTLGPYVHKREFNELYKEEQFRFYIDLPGERMESYYYQVEKFLGIFEGSEIYKKVREMGEGYLGMDADGYYYEDAEVFPAFDAEVSEYVKSGGHQLAKHQVIGYYRDSELVKADRELLETIFCEDNRMSDLMRDVGIA